MARQIDEASIGLRNIRTLYAFTLTSRLWFDGGLWVIYFQHRGLSLFEIGLLEALLHIVAVVSDVPIGAFADRFGWRISLGCGTVLGVGYTLVALFASNPWWIAVAFAARGLQITLTNGSDASIAYESAVWANIADRYRAITGRMFALTLVSIGVAEAVGGWLASYSWTAVYVAFTAANVASFFTVLWLKEPRGARTLSEEADTTHSSVLTILQSALHFARSNPAFVKWITMSAILSGFTATFAFYGQAILLHAGWGLVGIGILMGIENAIGALGSLLADGMASRLGESRTMSLVGIVASIGLVVFGWVPGILSGVGYLLDSIAANLAEPIIDNGLNKLLPSTQRATLLSANSTAFSLFMVALFPLFGALASAYSLSVAAHVASIVGGMCVMTVIAWWRREAKMQKHRQGSLTQ